MRGTARALNSPSVTRFVFGTVGLFHRWLTATPLWQDSLREMSRHFPPGAAELRIVDVGCGPGTFARHLLTYRPDLRILGLDFALGMLRLARRETAQDSRFACTQADLTKLPLPSSSVDAVIGNSVFNWLGDEDSFLREVLRVLRPGGRLILLDPIVFYPRSLIQLAARRPKAALSMLLWHGIGRAHRRFTLEEMADQLTQAGFARVLAESAVEGYGILSRGEKPYPSLSTIERIASIAQQDSTDSTLKPVDAGEIASRGRFVYVLVRQTPDKPIWAIQPGESIRWDAAMVSDEVGQPYLLVFTSLPKAVEFMQPAVTHSSLLGIKKVAKFDKATAASWGVDVLLNPAFETLRQSQHYRFQGATLNVDPAAAVMGEE